MAVTCVVIGQKQKSRELTLGPSSTNLKIKESVGKDMTQLFHDFLFGMRARDRQLFHQKISRRVEHFSFAKGKFLIALQHKEVSQHLSDLKNRAGFNLLGVLTITAIPGLLVSFYFFLTQHFVNLGNHGPINNFTQTHGLHVVDGNHDLHIRFENPKHVELLFRTGNNVASDGLDLSHPVRGINYFLADLAGARAPRRASCTAPSSPPTCWSRRAGAWSCSTSGSSPRWARWAASTPTPRRRWARPRTCRPSRPPTS